MAIRKNSINKLIAEIVVPAVEDAASVQTDFSSFLKSHMLPLIESVADRLVPSGEIIRLDRLELDFENFVPGGNNIAALEAFEQKLEEQLRRVMRPSDYPNSPAAETIGSRQADEELFIFLLKEGHLPWWAETTEPVVLQELAARVLKEGDPSFQVALRKLLRELPARRRVAHQLSVVLIGQLLYSVSAEPGQMFSFLTALKNLAARISATIAAEHSHQLVSAEFFWRLMVERILNYLDGPPAPGAFVSEMIRWQQQEGDRQPGVLLLLEQMAEELRIVEPGHLPVKPGSDDSPVRTHSKNNKPAETKAQLSDPLKWMEEISSHGNGYFVRNAGLVILSPYIPSFFKTLGLVQENKFVSSEAQQRAAYLLHYLSTGSESSFEEHDMLLSKTLCGINLLTPLTLQFALREQEKEECQALLQAVVTHWTALKSTSPESMRDAFFIREGILESHANGWNLKIERTTLDVLVDKLPWGISIVKMPWSTELIFVNW